jgi:predicted secreted protein
MLRIPALVLVLTSACSSSGYERASAAADKTGAYRDNLVRLEQQVGLAAEALRALSENPGDSPRSNKETFETYTRELANLEAASKRSRKTYGKMDGRAERFFGGWNEDTARITNADLKHSAEGRRAALQANYATLERGQAEVDLALARFVGELTDLRVYLEHDLTAAGIASARSTIEQAFASAAALRAQLGAQVRASDSARGSLEPLKDLAPSEQLRASSSSRVR